MVGTEDILVAAFASATELGNRLGITLTVGETTRATALLTLTSDLIRDEAGQTIELVEGDILTRPGEPRDRVRLPERPVVSVAAVTINEVALAEGVAWYLDGDEIVRIPTPTEGQFPDPRYGGGWGQPDDILGVTYDHGYAVIPGAIKAVCLEAVVRVWVNPGVVRQEGYGSEQISYPDGSGLLLNEDERRAIRLAVRRTAGTINLR